MIRTPEALKDLLNAARARGRIALDTEFVWERTYYPRLGVVQAAIDADTCALIDPLALPDPTPLGALLSDPTVQKILHDAQQDLIILRRTTGAAPRNVFDTQCAAGFSGMRATISLADLVKQVTGLEMKKTQQRTNWLRRPLTDAQAAYALMDVRHLPGMAEHLLEQVRRCGNLNRLQEELAGLDDPTLYEEKDPDEQYLRIRSGRLNPVQRSALHRLAAWREREARRRDRPRGRILTDRALVAVARRGPADRRQLAAIEDISARCVRMFGQKLLECVAAATDAPPAAESSPGPTGRIAPDLKRRSTTTLARIRACAEANDIDPVLVASRAEVTALLQAPEQALRSGHRLLQGWRRELVGREILATVDAESD